MVCYDQVLHVAILSHSFYHCMYFIVLSTCPWAHKTFYPTSSRVVFLPANILTNHSIFVSVKLIVYQCIIPPPRFLQFNTIMLILLLTSVQMLSKLDYTYQQITPYLIPIYSSIEHHTSCSNHHATLIKYIT